MSQPLRIAVVGATGTLGTELLEILAESRLRIGDLVPVATDHSLGEEIEFGGRSISVETRLESLNDFDLLLLCTPPEVALDWVRKSLQGKVPCFDLSGSVSENPDVPLLVARENEPLHLVDQPVLACPGGPVLACFLALAPLAKEVGLRRVVVTCFEPVSNAGRAGIETLQNEVLAVFNQEEMPEPSVFSRHIAFNCIPFTGGKINSGPFDAERRFSDALGRLLNSGTSVDSTLVQVPTFSGMGASVAVETELSLEPKQACALLANAPEVRLWDDEASEGPTTRDAAAVGDVLVGRVRRSVDPERGLLFWLAADSLHLSAANAVRLVEGRFATP